jgi:putative insertion element HTH domain-containing protein
VGNGEIDGTNPPTPPNLEKSDLTERQLTAMNLLLSGATDTDVARTLNVDRKTIYNWRTKNEAFKSEYEQRGEAMFGNQRDKLRRMVDTALSNLDSQMHDPYYPTSHRASRTVLNLARLGKWLEPAKISSPLPR